MIVMICYKLIIDNVSDLTCNMYHWNWTTCKP